MSLRNDATQMRRQYCVEGNFRPIRYRVVSNSNPRSLSVRVDDREISPRPSLGEHVPAKTCRPRLAQHDRRHQDLNEPEESDEAGGPGGVAVSSPHDVSRRRLRSSECQMAFDVACVTHREWIERRLAPQKRVCHKSRIPIRRTPSLATHGSDSAMARTPVPIVNGA
jgi:hypothetical protein